ncbi:MAG: FHA domain-containing protein [Anaerolineales bacterium]|jgi:pSer/pThr/pTyr-binding forkhead associated (FHA) protein
MSANPEKTKSAFLIVEGKRAISLERSITTIGRKPDNHIVIDDQHVSRYHAQIRKINDSYELIDLESTVGTSINSSKVTQAFLKDGDVISIGGIPLLFGTGTPKINLEHPKTGLQNSAAGLSDTIQLDQADDYLDLFNTSRENETSPKDKN